MTMKKERIITDFEATRSYIDCDWEHDWGNLNFDELYHSETLASSIEDVIRPDEESPVVTLLTSMNKQTAEPYL